MNSKRKDWNNYYLSCKGHFDVKKTEKDLNTLEALKATESKIDPDVTSPIEESSFSSVLMIIEPVWNTWVCCIDEDRSFKAVIISFVVSEVPDI